MNGMAGTGKTTIAFSASDALERDCQLGAGFFCSRLLPDCRDVNKIIPTVVYQLASFSNPFRSSLRDVLDSDRDIGSYNLDTQFDKLLREPLLKVKASMPANVVVVIDALDECSDGRGTKLILNLLFRYAAELPIKFFVTSRPEPSISNMMRSQDNDVRSILILHEIEEGIVQADIETYLSSELAAISPPRDQIRQLAEQAGNLFIYAATAVRYICPDNLSVNSLGRLKTMLEMNSNQKSNKHKEIDILYADILSSALDDQGWEQWEVDTMQLVLHTVICIREPTTSEVLANLLGLDDESQVELALEHLRSVLHVSEGTGIISALHASFPDYMLNQERSGRFFCDEAQHSRSLAIRCFGLMKDLLRFNICDLSSSYVLDEDVPNLSDRVNERIVPHLLYACKYWGDHLSRAGSSSELCDLLSDFLSVRLLFWMEVLNLGICIDSGGSVLQKARAWLEVS
jgi:hypothetical protein